MVGVRRATDDEFAGLPQLMRLGALAEHVIEDDDIGPGHLRHPILGLRHEPVGDLTLALRFDEQLDLVPFLDDLPGDVGDEAIERDEEELFLIQCQLQRVVNCGKGMKKAGPSLLLKTGRNKSKRRPFDSQ